MLLRRLVLVVLCSALLGFAPVWCGACGEMARAEETVTCEACGDVVCEWCSMDYRGAGCYVCGE